MLLPLCGYHPHPQPAIGCQLIHIQTYVIGKYTEISCAHVSPFSFGLHQHQCVKAVDMLQYTNRYFCMICL